MSTPTDTELLNWLDEQGPHKHYAWICFSIKEQDRAGVHRRYEVLVAYEPPSGHPIWPNVRFAIAAAMEKQRKEEHGTESH